MRQPWSRSMRMSRPKETPNTGQWQPSRFDDTRWSIGRYFVC